MKEEKNKKQKEERNNEYGAYNHLFESQAQDWTQNQNNDKENKLSKSLNDKIEEKMIELNSQSNYLSYSYGNSSSSSNNDYGSSSLD